ncbi:hypothetical protein HOF92_12360 [bacterium]|jgi:hypothetical protein|nr:hypothetical protein [bacterium]
MKLFVLFFSFLGFAFSADGYAEILVPEDMQNSSALVQDSEFMAHAKAYKGQLEDLEYSARRHSWYFGYSEIETMKAISHLLHLVKQIIQHGETSSHGKESFYQMKQPLTYVSQFLPYNPLFSHVVSTWDQSLQSYHRMVQLHTGTDVHPSPPVDFNDPRLKRLQVDMRELKEVVQHLQHQLKTGLVMIGVENHALIAYVDEFSVHVGKMHSCSFSFVTQRYELENSLKQSIRVSRQITAIVLYHPNEYIKAAWQVVRDKANIARQTFEDLMNPVGSATSPSR